MSESLNIKLASVGSVNCNTCSLSSLCLPVSLNSDEALRLDEIIEKSKPHHKGDLLFRQGDTFNSLFAIRAGSLKTYSINDKGQEQINGFYFPGELVGLAGIDSGTYPMSAQMLETTTVCEIPFKRLDNLSGQLPELRRQVMRAMSREIRDDQQMMNLLSQKTSEQRIATFLLRIAHRYSIRGYSSQAFRLSMSRNEIGHYLGLAVETVSRTFTRFSSQQLIIADGKELQIINENALREVAGERHASECHIINAN